MKNVVSKLNSVGRLVIATALLCHYGFATDVKVTARHYLPNKPSNGAIDLQYGFLSAPLLGNTAGNVFRGDRRATSGRIGGMWIPTSKYGELALGGAVGFMFARIGGEAVTGIPVEANIGYHAKYFPRQFLVPVFRFGMGYTTLLGNQRRSATTYDYTFGLHILLNMLDQSSSHSMYRTIGVSSTYLTVEYTTVKNLGTPSQFADLSGNVIRLGFRFGF